MNRIRRLYLLLCCSMSLAVAAAEKDEPPVQLEPVRVAAIWSNAVVRIEYLPDSEDWRIAKLLVESVREKSAAARAGLEKGMEIVAIQGIALSGITEQAYQRVMRMPVDDVLVLSVRRAGRVKSEEMRIPVAK
jgi:C-terminal processing protease CtpA/Prc